MLIALVTSLATVGAVNVAVKSPSGSSTAAFVTPSKVISTSSASPGTTIENSSPLQTTISSGSPTYGSSAS